MSRLPDAWVARIFQSLTGIYGAQFRSKFSQLENGVDIGIAMASQAWAKELGSFSDMPESIAYALDHLPTDHAPNALEFRDICRRAPRKEQVSLPHKLTEEDHEKARKVMQSAKESMANKMQYGIDYHWATHPRGHSQLKFIFDAAKRDPRFQPAIAEMVKKGICDQDGQLLKVYRDQQWFHAERKAA